MFPPPSQACFLSFMSPVVPNFMLYSCFPGHWERRICPLQEPWVLRTVTSRMPSEAHEKQFAFSSGKPRWFLKINSHIPLAIEILQWGCGRFSKPVIKLDMYLPLCSRRIQCCLQASVFIDWVLCLFLVHLVRQMQSEAL